MVKLFTELMSDAHPRVRERKRTWSQFSFLDPFIFTDHMILYVISEAKQFHLFCWDRDPCLLDQVLSPDLSHPREPVWTRGCTDSAKAGPLGQSLWPSKSRSSSVKDHCLLLSLTLTSLLSPWALCFAIIGLQVLFNTVGLWASKRLWVLIVYERL